MISLRCSWQVTAGVLPGTSEHQYTRRWHLASNVWERDNEMTDEEFKAQYPEGKSTFITMREEAYAYAATLHDPRSFNWVRVDWVWY
jgi:hypothetical protein